MNGKIPSLCKILLLLLIQRAHIANGEACRNTGADQVILPTWTDFYGLFYNLEVTFQMMPRLCFKISVDFERKTFKLIFCDKKFKDCVEHKKNFSSKYFKEEGMYYDLSIIGTDVYIHGCRETEIANHEEFFWGSADPNFNPTEKQKVDTVDRWFRSHGLDVNTIALEFPKCNYSHQDLKGRFSFEWKYFYLIFGVLFVIFVVFVICK